MWAFYEGYDPKMEILYLDLRDAGLPEPVFPGVRPRLLEKFESVADARAFADGYLQALHYDAKRVLKEVHCGGLRHPDCKGYGGSCPVGLDDFWCPVRCGPRSLST